MSHKTFSIQKRNRYQNDVSDKKNFPESAVLASIFAPQKYTCALKLR